jgi:hypothetical protein
MEDGWYGWSVELGWLLPTSVAGTPAMSVLRSGFDSREVLSRVLEKGPVYIPFSAINIMIIA